MINIGIIGCGGISAAHYNAIKASEDVSLLAICDTNKERLKEAKERYNVSVAYLDHMELISRDDIDAVIVCTPHKYHKDIVIDALNYRKHVLCEKPLTISVDDGKEMIKAAEKNKVVLQTAENHPFEPHFQLMQRFLKEGFLGSLYTTKFMQIWNFPSYTWRKNKEIAGGGCLIDDGIHLITMAILLAGDVEKIFSSVDTFRQLAEGKEVDVEDNAFCILEHKSGVKSFIHASWTSPISYFHHEAQGENGSVLYRNIGSKYEMSISGFDYDIPPLPEGISSPESYLNQLRHFVDCIKEGKKPFLDGEEGLKVVSLVLAAYESNDLGEPVLISN